jgi:hypothetical protein
MLTAVLSLSVFLNVGMAGRWWFNRSNGRHPYKRVHDLILVFYVIRRRLQVSQFRVEVRREAAAVRRDLAVELDALRRQEGGRL